MVRIFDQRRQQRTKIMISTIPTTLTAAQIASLVSKVTEGLTVSVPEAGAVASGWLIVENHSIKK